MEAATFTASGWAVAFFSTSARARVSIHRHNTINTTTAAASTSIPTTGTVHRSRGARRTARGDGGPAGVLAEEEGASRSAESLTSARSPETGPTLHSHAREVTQILKQCHDH